MASWKDKDKETPTALDAINAQLSPVIFDVNGGLMPFDEWEAEVVPLITKSIPRADGDWHVTHSWEVEA